MHSAETRAGFGGKSGGLALHALIARDGRMVAVVSPENTRAVKPPGTSMRVNAVLLGFATTTF